jgi:hypothetical protein
MVTNVRKLDMKQLLLAALCLFVGLAQMTSAPEATNKPEAQAQKKRVKANRVQAAPKQKVSAPATIPKVKRNTRVRSGKTASAAKAKVASVNRVSYADALQRSVRERHDRAWWHRHYTVIVLAGTGYYYWDAGYWYPAWGYDPAYDYFDYNGPIYTYGDLLPDRVIMNVQRALQELGYYTGGLTGSLGRATRQAIATYQQDAGLTVTAAIDPPTVEALGLE